MANRLAYALFESNWKIRRWVVFLSLGFFGLLIVRIVFWGDDSALNAQLGLAFTTAFVSIVMSYVFGAVADDYDKRKTARFNHEDLMFDVPTPRYGGRPSSNIPPYVPDRGSHDLDRSTDG